MTKARFLIGVAGLMTFLQASGCAYGPEHLPAFYSQRDHFQKLIDDIVSRMVTDKEWWATLSPAERSRWRDFVEHALLEERERALNAMESLDACLVIAGPNESSKSKEGPAR